MDLFGKINEVLIDLEQGGYQTFLNYYVFRALINNPESGLRRLFFDAHNYRPEMDPVNLVCTLNGSVNYHGERLLGYQKSLTVFENPKKFDKFIDTHFELLLGSILELNNNPTIPQRAFPIYSLLQRKNINNAGIVELGCSRGDIGLTLLNSQKIIAHGSEYLFRDFIYKTNLQELTGNQLVSKYLGIDIDISLNDQWLLSLWGLKDERRQQLRKFYEDFLPNNNRTFFRLKSNACELNQYLPFMIKFMENVSPIVILTSFMIYQLSRTERLRLISSIYKMNLYFNKIIWLDQGMDIKDFLDGGFRFDQIFINELSFDNNKLLGTPLIKIFNDACEGWELISPTSPIIIMDQLLDE